MPFFNIRNDRGIYYAEAVSPFVAGYASKEGNAIDYSATKERIRVGEKKLVGELTGLSPSHIFFLDQEHGARIVRIEKPTDPETYCADHADAMITDIPGFCLIIRSADCVPVILIDPVKKIVGAVHSGWRGCELGISGNTVCAMKTVFASNPQAIQAYIFPSIGPSSYQVSKDVAEKFPGCFIVTESGYYLDLWKSVEQSLESAGVKPENIFNNRLCTLENNDRFYSHRADDVGRTLNFIFMSK